MKRGIGAAALSCILACGAVMPQSGGGDIEPPAAGRKIKASDIALSAGYEIKPVATGLTFPTGVTFDDQGQAYVVEGGYDSVPVAGATCRVPSSSSWFSNPGAGAKPQLGAQLRCSADPGVSLSHGAGGT